MKEFEYMKLPNKVKNLVLDFGGVIYTISHARHKKAFARLGVENFGQLYSQAAQSPLFADFECGRIDEEEFRSGLLEHLGHQFDAEKLDAAWNSILVGFEDQRIGLLKQLSNKYNLYLLSNTNIIHYRIYTQEFFDRYGFDFNSLFLRTYWSFKIGMRKPEPEIYKLVMRENELSALDTVFVDDTRQNIVGAQESGMPAFWLEPGRELQTLFDGELRLKL